MPSELATSAAAPQQSAFHVEKHGFDFIPLNERTMTLRQAALFWAGTQANFVPVSLGVVAVTLGLNLWQALISVIIGCSFFAYVGVACVAGPRAGVPTLTFTRSAFGPKGNQPNVALTWAALVAFEALNTILAALAILAFLPVIGIADPGRTTEVLAVLAVIGLSVAVAALGHAAMIWLQRIAAVILVVALILVLATTLGGAHWADGQSLDTGHVLALMTVAIAANASGPLAYLFCSPEWFRYLPRDVSARKVSWTLFASGGGVAVLLGLLGAELASQVDMSDPLAGPKDALPVAIYAVFLLAAVLGTLANNVPTLYSAGLTLQALGVPISRFFATVLNAVIAAGVTLWVLASGGFLDSLETFASLLVVWLGPFGGVYVSDAILRRWRWDPTDLHDRSPRGQYWGRNGWNIPGWIALGSGMLTTVMTMNSVIYVGPVAHALGGTDLSWLLGLPVSAAVYVALSATRLRSPDAERLGLAAWHKQQTEHESEAEVLARERHSS